MVSVRVALLVAHESYCSVFRILLYRSYCLPDLESDFRESLTGSGVSMMGADII